MKLGIAGGGTGGHLFPGLAIAERARQRGDADEVVFFGAHTGIETRVVPAAGFELLAAPVAGVVDRGGLAAAMSVARIVAASFRIRGQVRRRGLSAMVGLGGYASFAGVLGAWMARVPVVLLEQNRAPGLANRVLARLASVVCTSFAETASALPGVRVVETGNPLRGALQAPASQGTHDTLLVFGGSGGAHSLNVAMSEALPRLAEQTKLPPVFHQTGAADVDSTRAAYAEGGVQADVVPFIQDMAAAYARARLVVCRAGATSAAELTATATPSVLVPLRSSAAGHQRSNAETLVAAGAAVMVEDDEQLAAGLIDALSTLLTDDDRLAAMAMAARGLARPGAADHVLDEIVALVAGPAPAGENNRG